MTLSSLIITVYQQVHLFFVFDENGNFVGSFRICLLFKTFKPFIPVIDYGLNQYKIFTINIDTKGG